MGLICQNIKPGYSSHTLTGLKYWADIDDDDVWKFPLSSSSVLPLSKVVSQNTFFLTQKRSSIFSCRGKNGFSHALFLCYYFYSMFPSWFHKEIRPVFPKSPNNYTQITESMVRHYQIPPSFLQPPTLFTQDPNNRRHRYFQSPNCVSFSLFNLYCMNPIQDWIIKLRDVSISN